MNSFERMTCVAYHHQCVFSGYHQSAQPHFVQALDTNGDLMLHWSAHAEVLNCNSPNLLPANLGSYADRPQSLELHGALRDPVLNLAGAIRLRTVNRPGAPAVPSKCFDHSFLLSF
jgi:hypothetical protein